MEKAGFAIAIEASEKEKCSKTGAVYVYYPRNFNIRVYKTGSLGLKKILVHRDETVI